MGLCASAQHVDAAAREARRREIAQNLAIEKVNVGDHEVDLQIKKLLLLGAGESGKSTLFKQMVDLYGTGFTEKEILDYVPIVYNNTIVSMQTLCRQSEVFAHNDEAKHDCRMSPDLENHKKMILGLEAEAVLTVEIANAVKMLWADHGVKTTFAHRASFQIPDSASYFFENVLNFTQPNYRPNKMDMLRCRVRTTGILETNFQIEDLKLKMFDVGGQRNERKKWIHCFENVTAVIFVAAISEYDQLLYEDDRTNRMVEALNLFEEICNSRWFTSSSVILFLNKRDLFEEKLKHVPLTVCFRDYKGPNEYEPAWKYISEQFSSRKQDPEKQIYTHVTCATDDKNVLIVFNSVKDTIIRNGLMRSGML